MWQKKLNLYEDDAKKFQIANCLQHAILLEFWGREVRAAWYFDTREPRAEKKYAAARSTHSIQHFTLYAIVNSSIKTINYYVPE